MKFQLTTEQSEAAADLDANIALSASAGSGKTSTLVERFVNILRSGRASVDEIAAVTFTEKAANELKERVHSRIRELASGESDPGMREKWHSDLMAVETAQVSTIHSFCTQILREYAIQAGVDPAFGVADELHAQLFREGAVREALVAAVTAADPAVGRLLEIVEFSVLSQWLLEALEKREAVAVLSGRFGIEKSPVQDVASELHDAASRVAREMAIEALTAPAFVMDVSRLSNMEGPKGDLIEGKRRAFLAAHADWLRNKNADLLESLVLMEQSIDALRGGSKAKWGTDFQEVKDILQRVRKEVSGAREMLKGVELEKWGDIAGLMCDFVALHNQANACYLRRKSEEGVLDFDDLVTGARDLVVRHDDVAAALAKRFRFILVDEFQDTDHVQYELVKAIAAKGANLFVVGDRQQSIYAFRGAEVDVFSGLTADYAETGRGLVMRLSTTQRTLGHIVQFINVLFGKLMSTVARVTGAVPYEPMTASRAGSMKRVELILATGGRGISHARSVEARVLAKRVKEIVDSGRPQVCDGGNWRPPRYGDFAILFRSMASVGIYEGELAAAEIPFYTVAGSTYYLRQEIKDIVNVLRAALNPDDTLALVAALRSPLFGVSDDFLAGLCVNPLREYFVGLEPVEGDPQDVAAFKNAVELIRRLRKLGNRIGASEAIDEVFEATGFPAALAMLRGGRQRVANVAKLRDAAAAFDARGVEVLNDFVNRLSQLETREARESEAVIEDEQSSVVRLMTIHAAKGLEFPIVVIADMGRKRSQNAGRGGAVCIDRDLGIHLPVSREEPSFHGEIVRRKMKLLDEQEEQRVFFVGATRSRDHLILSGAAVIQPSGGLKVEGWAERVIGALDLPAGVTADRDLEGVTLEYAVHGATGGGHDRSYSRALMSWRDHILSGKTLPVASMPDEELILQRCQPIGPQGGRRHRFTATELADFGRCPLRFELAHLRGIPPDYVLNDAGQGSGIRGDMVGTVLHEVLEKSRDDEPLSSVLEMVIGANPSYAAVKNAIRAQCLPILARYEKSAFRKRTLAAGGRQRELQFSYLLGEHMIEGKMDLCVDGEVVDFKSDQVAAGDAFAYAERYRTQVDCYVVAYGRLAGRAPRKATLYFLRPGVEVSWDCDENGLAEAAQRILVAIEGISTGPPYRFDPRDDCRCEYRTLCGLIAERRRALALRA